MGIDLTPRIVLSRPFVEEVEVEQKARYRAWAESGVINEEVVGAESGILDER